MLLQQVPVYVTMSSTQVQALACCCVLQLSVRSLNNLDERFHHSYFLYLLTSLANFVTVEMYIIPLVLLISALLLKVSSYVYVP
jgi:hypothetical protein